MNKTQFSFRGLSGGLLLSLSVILPFSHAKAQPVPDVLHVRSAGGDIQVLTFDRQNIALKIIQTVHNDRLPMHFALHPQGRFLFTVNKLGLPNMSEWGSLTSYAVDPATGKLTKMNEQPSYGKNPVHISIYRTGNWMFVANDDGSLAVLSINPGGRIGTSSQTTRFEDKSQAPSSGKASHPSFSYPTGDGRFIYVADEGLDKVVINRFDNGKGTITPAAQPSIALDDGSGPSAFLIHPDGNIAFVAESKISAIHTFGINNNDGRLASIMTEKTVPPDYERANEITGMHLHPNGHYLYAVNSGHNSIAIIDVLSVNDKIKLRTTVDVAGNPVSLTIDPSGKFAFVTLEDEDAIAIFSVSDDGGLKSVTSFKMASPSYNLFSGARR